MRTEYVDYGGIIAVVYALKEVLHLQILKGNQEHKRSQKYSDHIYHMAGLRIATQHNCKWRTGKHMNLKDFHISNYE